MDRPSKLQAHMPFTDYTETNESVSMLNHNGSMSVCKSLQQLPRIYKEEDILSLNVKGSSVFESEKRSVEKILQGEKNPYSRNFTWMKNHQINEDLEGEEESKIY